MKTKKATVVWFQTGGICDDKAVIQQQHPTTLLEDRG